MVKSRAVKAVALEPTLLGAPSFWGAITQEQAFCASRHSGPDSVVSVAEKA